jgi:hypothetical protein
MVQDGLAGEVTESQGFAGRERMRSGQRHEGRVIHQVDNVRVWQLSGRSHQCCVETTAQRVPRIWIALETVCPDRHVWVLLPEGLDDLGDHDTRLEADRQAGQPRRGLHLAASGGGVAKQRRALLDKHAPCIGQRDVLAIALEKLDAELDFEGFDSATESGLRDVQITRRLGEAQALGYRQEVADLAQVHVRT